MRVAFHQTHQYTVFHAADDGGDIGESGEVAAFGLLGRKVRDGRIKQPLHQIDIVATGVQKCATAFFVVHDPTALARRMGATCRNHYGFANFALTNAFSRYPKSGVEPLHKSHHEKYFCFAAGFQHFVGLL